MEMDMKKRKHICEVCGVCFVKNAYLVQHKLSHQEVKGFICSYTECGKSYTRFTPILSYLLKF